MTWCPQTTILHFPLVFSSAPSPSAPPDANDYLQLDIDSLCEAMPLSIWGDVRRAFLWGDFTTIIFLHFPSPAFNSIVFDFGVCVAPVSWFSTVSRSFNSFVTTSAAFFAIFYRFRTVFELGVPSFAGVPPVSLVFPQLAPHPSFVRPGILGPYSGVASSRILSLLMVFTPFLVSRSSSRPRFTSPPIPFQP